MAFLGSGGAKLILFGEHAVVHGYPALGTGVSGQLDVRWTPGEGPLELACPVEYQPFIRRAFQDIAGHFDFLAPGGDTSASRGESLPGGLLEFSSSIPVSAGLGSSGAVCVAMARAMAAYASCVSGSAEEDQGSGPADTAIWAAAHAGEQVFHGRPSGVDTGLALWRKLTLFTPMGAALPVPCFLPPSELQLVYGTVPRESSCAANVAAIGKAMAKGDTGVAASMARLGRLSSQAAALLSLGEPDASGLGSLASDAMDLLRSLGLSTPVMEAILAAGMAAGASGGKLSGGGAGGAFWLACPDGSAAARIQAAVMEEARRLELPGAAFTGVIKL